MNNVYSEEKRPSEWRTKFNLKIGINLDEFPLNPINNELKYTFKNIDGKNFIGILYTYVDEDNLDYYAEDRKIKSETNKLFPKYILIDGLVASKGKIQSEYMFDNSNHRYKYYCDYDISHDGEYREQRVFVDEIENYEVVGKKVKWEIYITLLTICWKLFQKKMKD